jgi:RimJ/RimL family protein N-acetyltransferase
VDPRAGNHLPHGYPAGYARHVRLQDGRRVFIRPILPSDAPALARAIKTADADTLRRRFLGGPPTVTGALLARLTCVDYRRRFALVAIDPATGCGVGIARYEPAGDDTAEVAVAVSPSWRRAGLATRLILLLAQAALERGVVTFTASYLAENHPVAALAEQADGLCKKVIKQGIAELSIAIGHPGGTTSHTNRHRPGQGNQPAPRQARTHAGTPGPPAAAAAGMRMHRKDP